MTQLAAKALRDDFLAAKSGDVLRASSQYGRGWGWGGARGSVRYRTDLCFPIFLQNQACAREGRAAEEGRGFTWRVPRRIAIGSSYVAFGRGDGRKGLLVGRYGLDP